MLQEFLKEHEDRAVWMPELRERFAHEEGSRPLILRLTLHEAVVGYGMGEFLAQVLADISQVERLQVTETVGVEQDEDGHDLTVGHLAGTVTMPPARFMKCMFFQLWGEIFAEFVENTENFY